VSATANPKPDKGHETPEKFLVIVLDKADSTYVGFVVRQRMNTKRPQGGPIRKENNEVGDESDEEAGFEAVDIYPRGTGWCIRLSVVVTRSRSSVAAALLP